MQKYFLSRFNYRKSKRHEPNLKASARPVPLRLEYIETPEKRRAYLSAISLDPKFYICDGSLLIYRLVDHLIIHLPYQQGVIEVAQLPLAFEDPTRSKKCIMLGWGDTKGGPQIIF